MNLVDTHSHLYLPDFVNDIDEVVSKAKENNIKRIFLPNIDSSTLDDLNNLCNNFPDYFHPMVGLHPCSVKDDFENELKFVEEQLLLGSYCAVGEIGIDLYWDKSYLAQQQEAFRSQIVLAKKHKLPIVIHARDSFDEIFSIVDELNDSALSGIFHCFTGNFEQAMKIADYGNFKLGIGGVVTFKNAGLDKVIKKVDLDHIVLETDSPYLAPVPYRGKRNESSYLLLIAEKIAEVKNVKIEDVNEYILGYTVCNDVSARRWQGPKKGGGQ